MKKVYVAGAYSANNVIDVLKNIGRGEHFAADIFMLGMAPFCPWHDKQFVTDNWARDFTVKQFYDYSIAWLKCCDAMFLVPGYETSKGTAEEIEIARKMGIPVFDDIGDLIEWNINEVLK